MKNKYMTKNRSYKFDVSNIHYYTTIFIIALQICYPFKALLSNNIIIPIYIIWLILSIFLQKYYLYRLSKNLYFIIMFTLFVFIKMLLGRNFSTDFYGTMNPLISFINLIIYYSMYIYILKLNNYKKQRILQNCFRFIFISIIFSIYYVVFKDQDAIRYAKYEQFFGVGDFELIYSIVLFVSILSVVIVKDSKKRCIVTLFVLSIILLLEANYMTAIVLSVYALFIGIYISKFKNILMFIFTNVTICTIVLIIKDRLALMILKLADIKLLSDIISNKMIAISNLLIGSGDLNTIENRNYLSNISLNSFKENPILGIDYSKYGFSTVGAHAAWVDNLARYGFIGTSLLIIALLIIAIYMYKNANNEIDKKCIFISWVNFFILGLFNPNMMSTVFIMIFIIAPIMSNIYNEEEVNNVSIDINSNTYI